MIQRLTWGVIAVLAAAGLGCSGSGDIALPDLAERVIDVICVSNDCGLYPDAASCRAASSRSTLMQIQSEVASGKVKYDSAQAAACLEAVGAASKACRLSVSRIVDSSPCDKTFAGSVPEGGVCIADEDCVSQRCDQATCNMACCQGTCEAVAPPAIALGGDCSNGAGCVAGALCDFPSGTCTALKAAGETCTSSDECANGAVCLPTSVSSDATGACGRPPSTGEACFGAGTCDLIADFCDLTAQKCKPRLAIGAACGNFGDDDGCVRYAVCAATTQKCIARGGVGAACNPDGSDCQNSLDCTNGVCTARSNDPVCPQP